MGGINIKFLDKTQSKEIGFSYIVEKLDPITPYGLEEKRNIKPFLRQDLCKLQVELNMLGNVCISIEANKITYSNIERILNKMKDIRNSINRCENLDTLDDIELYELKCFGLLMNEFLLEFRKLELNIESLKFNRLDDLVNLLDPECKKIATFYIYNSYSEKLKIIRKDKEILEENIIIEKDESILKALKEQRLKIIIQEEEEELLIRKKLTKELSKYSTILRENIEGIGRLDFLIAKAKLSLRYNGVKPEISEKMKIVLSDVINPMVAEILELKGKKFTPLNIELNQGTSIVTGANMGGKSVALKTVVLNLLLSQCGFFVFAKKATIPILDFIHFISDDMQSITKGLSTFGAEILKLCEVIECAKQYRGFIALDEFARGTNPTEGYYLVKSVSEYLKNFNSISLISTHYDGIVGDKMVHYQVVGLKNVDFNSLKSKIKLNTKYPVELIQDHMEFRIERVSEKTDVPKDALNICMLLGLQDDVINIAKKYYKGFNKVD